MAFRLYCWWWQFPEHWWWKKHLLIDWVHQSFILPSPHTKNNSQIQEINNAMKFKLFFAIWNLTTWLWAIMRTSFFFLVQIKYLVRWKTDGFVIFCFWLLKIVCQSLACEIQEQSDELAPSACQFRTLFPLPIRKAFGPSSFKGFKANWIPVCFKQTSPFLPQILITCNLQIAPKMLINYF